MLLIHHLAVWAARLNIRSPFLTAPMTTTTMMRWEQEAVRKSVEGGRSVKTGVGGGG